MKKEDSFNKALAFSIIIHVSILLPLSIINFSEKQKKQNNKIEVNYVKVTQTNTASDRKISQEDLEKIGLRNRLILAEEEKIPSAGAKEETIQSDILAGTKDLPQKPNLYKTQFSPRNDIKLSLLETSKSQNPIYLNYQNFIRENLRRFLYNKYSDIPQRGEVYLTFILNANGSVKQAQVIEDKSTASADLRKIVIESLYDASPFPPLPAALNTPILSFSVTVHFKERQNG